MFLEYDLEFMNIPITEGTPLPSQQTLSKAVFPTLSTTNLEKWRVCVIEEGRERGRKYDGERERERNLQDSSRFQEAVPLITCVTLDDIRSQILDFTASHQGKFLPV